MSTFERKLPERFRSLSLSFKLLCKFVDTQNIEKKSLINMA